MHPMCNPAAASGSGPQGGRAWWRLPDYPAGTRAAAPDL